MFLKKIILYSKRLIKYKAHSKAPKRPFQIIIMGPPVSGRTTLARGLCEKYGFVHVSTVEILRDFINKKGKLSNMVLDSMKKGDLSLKKQANSYR